MLHITNNLSLASKRNNNNLKKGAKKVAVPAASQTGVVEKSKLKKQVKATIKQLETLTC